MKAQILKLCPVVLLFLFLGASCQKDEWVEIRTNDNHCTLIGESLGIISAAEGEIKTFNKSEYLIIAKDILGYSEMPLYPCNISFSELKENHKIIMSGEIYLYQGQNNDSIAIDFAAQPIFITNAKMYK